MFNDRFPSKVVEGKGDFQYKTKKGKERNSYMLPNSSESKRPNDLFQHGRWFAIRIESALVVADKESDGKNQCAIKYRGQ